MISKINILSIIILTIICSESYAIQDSIITNNLEKILNNNKSKVLINKINIKGNKKTNRNIITRELSFEEGQEFKKENILLIIKEDERKIVNTNLFNEVNINILPSSITSKSLEIVDINIEVIESFYWIPSVLFELSDRNFNDWWENFNHDLSRINYGLGLTQYNFTGNADQLELSFRLGFIKEFYGSYFLPYISQKQKGGIKFNMNYIDYDHLEYNTENYIPQFYKSKNSLKKHYVTSLEYSHRESFYNYHYFQLEYNNINMNDSIFKLNDNYFINNSDTKLDYLTLSYEFDRDFRDLKNYPLNGFRFNIKIEKNGLGISSNLNKLKIRLYYSKYIKLKNKYFYSFNISSVISSNNQPYILYENTYNIRGYEKYLIHGKSNVIFKNTFKKNILSKNISRNNQDYFKRIKNIPFKIYAKIFFDSGSIWKYSNTNINLDLNNNYLYSVGFGIDIVTIKNISLSSEISRNNQKNYNVSFKVGADF
ncbi:MAG: BamA/TamA family outer membrane protein [Cytophagales bacterium]